jgi:hypothetical protein
MTTRKWSHKVKTVSTFPPADLFDDSHRTISCCDRVCRAEGQSVGMIRLPSCGVTLPAKRVSMRSCSA